MIKHLNVKMTAVFLFSKHLNNAVKEDDKRMCSRSKLMSLNCWGSKRKGNVSISPLKHQTLTDKAEYESDGDKITVH